MAQNPLKVSTLSLNFDFQIYAEVYVQFHTLFCDFNIVELNYKVTYFFVICFSSHCGLFLLVLSILHVFVLFLTFI